ncbi:hypothetical protein F5897_001171 [Canibacter oris]|uniref:Acetone carboxylase n=1 Tax=Canibacter oris TaxID=1365628 RepID=A0A840DK46_9MICO|nr:hypothetical protein [Canibacter oris]MBB4071852.1 hypothetical protein [Canibacter oris]
MPMLDFFAADQPALICSRARCQEPAEYALKWANPKIHRDGRHKIWLACEAHLPYLQEFLTARDFLTEVTGVEQL